ncbi:hydrogenase maturation protease [Gordonia sp. i37]|uniref:hydrogenase maturation protease n=1 Tax=Gordonia sp. i37 TaxID=1961707 RepID=UPI0009ACD394|nr:hydrogenase maturation protease [Gordonia sp. i37]OPX07345.1 peptidase M52 [Gordonia sp. i37]
MASTPASSTQPGSVPPAPSDLLADDPHPPEPADLVVVGCGNLIRGDDAVGPLVIRRLWDRHGVVDGVRLVDGGTAGMDVAFALRGARRVIIVDAARTGQPPGTVFRLPAAELGDIGPDPGVHTHSFRWDHALGFARWMLGEMCPDDITVLLVEAQSLEPVAVDAEDPLSPPVAAAAEQVIEMITAAYPAPPKPAEPEVEFTDGGSLLVDADVAARYFPTDSIAARCDGDDLLIYPLRSTSAGGLLLKQRSAGGDRATVVRQVFDDAGRTAPVGRFVLRWDADHHVARVRIGER